MRPARKTAGHSLRQWPGATSRHFLAWCIERQSSWCANAEKLWSLSEMERTGGEPDVIGHDKKTGEYIFYHCSAESPTAFWSGILLFVRETGFASRLPRAPGARSAAQEPRRTQLFFRGYIELMPLIGYLQARGFGNLFATRVPADYLYHTPGRILRGVTLSFWRTDVGE